MPKSIPQRQCVGCREKKPKPELIRVVRAPDGGHLARCARQGGGPRRVSVPEGPCA